MKDNLPKKGYSKEKARRATEMRNRQRPRVIHITKKFSFPKAAAGHIPWTTPLLYFSWPAAPSPFFRHPYMPVIPLQWICLHLFPVFFHFFVSFFPCLWFFFCRTFSPALNGIFFFLFLQSYKLVDKLAIKLMTATPHYQPRPLGEYAIIHFAELMTQLVGATVLAGRTNESDYRWIWMKSELRDEVRWGGETNCTIQR